MNAFPADYVVHNLPLILVSGLESEPQDQENVGQSRTLLSEGGFRVRVDLPPASVPAAAILLQELLDKDTSKASWNGVNKSKDHIGDFSIRSIGRSFVLPPRKAPPPPHSPLLGPTTGGHEVPLPLVLHSTISPLTPRSPLYPDGIITPLWITKHQSRLPAVFMACFRLVADPNEISLHDNMLKAEIQNIRSVLVSTNYKSRLVVILLGDDVIPPADLDERLALIRRSANLDSKGLYYLPADSSQIQIRQFSRVLLTSLYPICVEYYRDLSKHARRKRNRGTIPLPTVSPVAGTPHLLPAQGWNVRYEFKLGIFAEFRQEMDAACRNYESAYENLFASAMIEFIASWSPRFNEARLLADVIAIRIIRCQLWTGQPTGAVRSWINHRDRVQDLLNRKGKGTANYGWEAWQSTWSATMADLMTRAEFDALSPRDLRYEKPARVNFHYPEKALPLGERIVPWEQLHHQGYWLNIAQKHTQARQQFAQQIPTEDRIEPGQSPASLIASKAHLYDTYLTLDPYAEYASSGGPGYGHARDRIQHLTAAISHFSNAGQRRFPEFLQLQIAKEYLVMSAWPEAFPVLQQLWSNRSWRVAGWWKLLSMVGNALLECASQLRDLDTMLRLEWELSNKLFGRQDDARQAELLSAIRSDSEDVRPSVVIAGDLATLLVVPTFVFASAEGNVGQPLRAQLCLKSHVRYERPAVCLSEVKVVFEGGLRSLHVIGHDKATKDHSPTRSIVDLVLQDSRSANKRSSVGAIESLVGNADLTLGPDSVAVFNLELTPREAGEVALASITLIVENDRGCLTQVSTGFHDDLDAGWWEMAGDRPIFREHGMERDVRTVKILPKLPLMRVFASNLESAYYTGEQIVLNIQVINDEEEDAIASMEVRLVSPIDHAANFQWSDDTPQTLTSPGQNVPGSILLPGRDLGQIGASASKQANLIIGNTLDSIDHEVKLVVRYVLQSDPETSLVRTVVVDIPVVRPFGANYNFRMRVHPDPWPNFFEAPHGASGQPSGLKQQYLAEASIHSFALTAVTIEKASLEVQTIKGNAICRSSSGLRKSHPGAANELEKESAKQIHPDETQIYSFDLTIQKLEPGDRQTVSAKLQLQVEWRRTESSALITSILEVPRFVPPMAEPRVLLTSSSLPQQAAHPAGMTIRELRYTIENPSMHFLTFNIGMESSEDFNFSGPKATTRSLVPLSRYELVYRIMSSKREAWIPVHLRVVDAYFDKALRVQAAEDEVRNDKKGNITVWIP